MAHRQRLEQVLQHDGGADGTRRRCGAHDATVVVVLYARSRLLKHAGKRQGEADADGAQTRRARPLVSSQQTRNTHGAPTRLLVRSCHHAEVTERAQRAQCLAPEAEAREALEVRELGQLRRSSRERRGAEPASRETGRTFDVWYFAVSAS